MRTIDIHAHWYPEEWLEVFEKDGAREGASLERLADGGYRLKAKHITNAFDERFVVVPQRVEDMDKRRIGVHALSLTSPMVYWTSPGLALALSQAFNDAASRAHLRFPDRLVGLAMLPMQAPEAALKEDIAFNITSPRTGLLLPNAALKKPSSRITAGPFSDSPVAVQTAIAPASFLNTRASLNES